MDSNIFLVRGLSLSLPVVTARYAFPLCMWTSRRLRHVLLPPVCQIRCILPLRRLRRHPPAYRKSRGSGVMSTVWVRRSKTFSSAPRNHCPMNVALS